MLQKIFNSLKFWHWSKTAWLRYLMALLPLILMLPHTLSRRKYEPIIHLDQRIYNQRLLWFTADNQTDERIVIVDIDEASLRQYGRWPWRRDVLAQLSQELLQTQQVALVGFDMLFAEPTTMSTILHPELSALGKAHDAELASSFQQQAVILGYHISTNEAGGENGALSSPLALRIMGDGLLDNKPIYDPVRHAQQQAALAPSTLLSIRSHAANMPELVQAAAGGGFMNVLRDSDGELRSIPLLAQKSTPNGVQYYPALSLAMFLHILNQPKIELISSTDPYDNRRTMAGLQLQQAGKSLFIPSNSQGAMLVPYRGSGGKNNGQFQYISAAQLLDGKLAAKSLQGRIALIGTSAAGLHDLRVTPVNIRYPGVEVHAAALSAMLDGHFIHTPDYAAGYSAAMVLLAVLILAIALPKVGPWGAWLWCAGLALGMTGLNFWLYVQAHVALPLAAAIVTIFISYILHMFYAFAREHDARKSLAAQFGSYIPPELVRSIIEQPTQQHTPAQSCELTIMFCDVQEFTKIAEDMEPTQVQAMLNRLFNRMTAIIAAHQGTIDKYIGDSIMAFWGAPKALDNHADCAIQAADAMMHMLTQFNQEQKQLGLPAIRLGIGINSGVVSVGDMGSDLRRSYTVLGDAVNLTARIEPLARIYGTPILVGERTFELASHIYWQWVDYVRVSGREQALHIYTPFDIAVFNSKALNMLQQRELQRWQEFHFAYVERNWQACKEIIDYLLLLRPKKILYKLYNDRINAFLAFPPGASWDGVTNSSLSK